MWLTRLGTELIKTLPAEPAHEASLKALKLGLGTPLYSAPDPPALATRLPISGLDLSNPIGLAAGYDKNAQVFTPLFKLGFGFVECGTVTPLAQAGNPRPRLFRLSPDKAVINRMGFNNQGLIPFTERFKQAPPRKGILGANIGANKISQGAARIEDYIKGLQALWPYCDYITINISSPNTPGLRGLQNKDELKALLEACQNTIADFEQRRPVFLKLAPDLDEEAILDIITVVRGARSFLTGLIISNTTLERPAHLKSAFKEEAGGLSGAPLLQRSTEVLRLFAKQVRGEFDLIGVGGISSGADAYLKIRAGAQAVQLYSALVYGGPALVVQIKKDLVRLLKEDGYSQISQAVGADL